MERLWAPWRAQYISQIGETDGCIFCEKPRQDMDEENLIVYRARFTFVIMNLFPYNSGHLMVVPYRHFSDLSNLSPEERLEIFDLSDLAVRALRNTYKPDGFNLGMNLGRSAGAGIDQHIHLHVVPRWNGDTNFMPIIGNTKVLSEALENIYRKLRKEFFTLSNP